MISSPHVPAASLVHVQQHLLDAITEGAGLTGTLDELGAWSGIAVSDLSTCIQALHETGWIAVQTEVSGRLRLRLDRRH